VMGPGVACECIESKDGLHLWEDHFYPEIVDPESGAVLPDGALGELVLTSLTREAMPVIRYRTRDLTRLLPGTARTMRRIARLAGRSDDMLIVRGVNVFPSHVEELVLRDPALLPEYQILLTREGRLDEMTVRVALAPGNGDGAANIRALRERIKTFAGISVRVELVEPAMLPASSGKAKRVFDLREGGPTVG